MPDLPYGIGFRVYEADEVTPASNVAFSAINERTGDILTGTTDVNGYGVIDCGNFTNGYEDGDYIRIAISGAGTLGTDYTYKAKLYTGYAEIAEIQISYD
jgi:hypothetical protein